MHMRVLALVMATATGLIAGACSNGAGSSADNGGARAGTGAANGGASNNGGAFGNGGSSGGSAAAGTCSNGTSCGGNVVGTWSVKSSCLAVSGELDLSLFGTGCTSAPVTGSLQVSGTWTANADGTYSDNTVTTGDEQITLAPSCLVISSVPVTCDGAANLLVNLGYSSFSCTSAANGGCNCTATVNQKGGLGAVSAVPSTSGAFKTAGNVLTITGDTGDSKRSYCVANDSMTWTPQSTSPTVTGTVAFQAGSGGSGGATGSGGAGPTAGAGPTGGAGPTAGAGPTGGATGSGGAGSSAGSGGAAGAGTSTGPCDIYKSGGNPCVAAHSTVRALLAAYAGKLYQVRNAAGATKDINALTAGGIADSAAQDSFCTGTTCVITTIYDQSGKGNDLHYQGADSPVGGKDKPASATGESLKIAGKKAYSLYINAGNSYWVDASKSGLPLGKEPEGMYWVVNGKHFNSGCCFDYGNSEVDRKADGAGAMDALNFSNTTAWGSGAGAGPWLMADLEYGLFAQGDTKKNPNSPSQTATFLTGLLKNNGTTEFALRGSDATAGNLSTYYKGALPGGWNPMKKQGAIVLGSGGDCCATNTNLSIGTFYEGAIVSGYPSDATENAVQANIVSAGYGN